MVKILVVDDETDLELLIKQKFRKQIADNTFEFIFSHNGLEALVALEKETDIMMVISDINMPEMDGLTLIDRIGEFYPNIIFVIMSAYGDMSNIRSAMKLGAYDFVTKPINFADLNNTINQALSHLRALRTTEINKDKLNSILQELNVAGNIQQSLLAKKFIHSPQIQIAGHLTACQDIGGDMYDFFYLNDNAIAFVVADVPGKGIASVLFMSVFRTILRARALSEFSPSWCLQRVNDLLLKENDNRMFVSAFYGLIELSSGHFSYCNAGNPLPLLIGKDGDIKSFPETSGIPLGVQTYTYQEVGFTLSPGDTLFMMTNGIIDATNAAGEKLGLPHLEKIVASAISKSADQLIQDVDIAVATFQGEQPLADDITMLTLKYHP